MYRTSRKRPLTFIGRWPIALLAAFVVCSAQEPGKYAMLDARPSVDWVRDAVIYEVFPRSFSKEGTFKALERRIPELKQLGVTIVWMMPIHPVGEINRKGRLGSPYAVQDYYGINPGYGTLEDFKSLVAETHRNGLKIIIDLVANHTAWDNKLTMEHPDWYMHNAEGEIVSPNADWTDVAHLNYGHHELRKYMIEMMKYWVRDIGVDGYRCDVAEMVPTDFWNIARSELEKVKPVVMLSEGSLPEHHVEAFDLTYSWNLYKTFDQVVNGAEPATLFDSLLRQERAQFPNGSLRMRFNTNHDENAWDAPAVRKFTPRGAKATAVLAFTLPGVPLIYNGEEAGNDKKLDLFDKVNIDWSRGKDFRELYTKLTALRAEHVALRRGSYVPLGNSGNPKVYSFARQSDHDIVVVVVNLSRQPSKAVVGIPDHKHVEQEYFSSKSYAVSNNKLSVELPPLGYAVFVPK